MKLPTIVLALSVAALAELSDDNWFIDYEPSMTLPDGCVKKGNKVKCASQSIKGAGSIYDLDRLTMYEYLPRYKTTPEMFSSRSCDEIKLYPKYDLATSIGKEKDSTSRAEMFINAENQMRLYGYYMFECFFKAVMKRVTCEPDGSYRLIEYDEVGIETVDRTGKAKGNSMCKDMFHKEYR